MTNRKNRMLILMLFFCLSTGLLTVSEKEMKADSTAENVEEDMETENASSYDHWELILVNKDHPVPDDWEVSLTLLSNGKKVDSRIYPDLQQMFDDARAEGLELFVREGYRTWEEQQQIMDGRIEEYLEEGYDQTEAQQLAEQWVAIPGTSEHQLGIAVDINADTRISSSDQVFSWLESNAHRYGFIKRYSADKSDITGISNEPWHFRYVGKEAAKEIFGQGLCLEEYLGLDS